MMYLISSPLALTPFIITLTCLQKRLEHTPLCTHYYFKKHKILNGILIHIDLIARYIINHAQNYNFSEPDSSFLASLAWQLFLWQDRHETVTVVVMWPAMPLLRLLNYYY